MRSLKVALFAGAAFASALVSANAADLGPIMQAPQMIARGQLRDYAAKEAMQLDLAPELVRQQSALGIEYGYRTLIAGGFNSNDLHELNAFCVFLLVSLESRPLPLGSCSKIALESRGYNFDAECSRTRERIF